MPQFVAQRRVEFSDTDMAGIVHFANFYRWMEEVEHEFFRSLGLSIMQTVDDETVIGWPRVSGQCSFEAPAHHDDILEIHLNVERIGVKSLTFSFEFHCKDRRIAYGRMKTACCLCRRGGALESIAIPPPYSVKIVEANAVQNDQSDERRNDDSPGPTDHQAV